MVGAGRGLNAHVGQVRRFRGLQAWAVGFTYLRIPCKNWKAGGSIREQLTALGILKTNGHEAFRGALTVPLFD
ncbi:MAG TPA: hypothetical protein VGK67_35940 [Myxococcales bacterium]